MAYERGDVVLIPFPFTDLSTAKTRPAVVVNSPLYWHIRAEYLLAYVSSQISRANPELDHVLVDWEAAGLLKPSFMRPKIAAIDPTLVVYHVGKLSAQDLSGIDACLRQALKL